MEIEVFGRYITTLASEGRRYAIFSKEAWVYGNTSLIMYEIDDVESFDTNPLNSPRPHQLPTFLKKEPITVYTSASCPYTQSELQALINERCQGEVMDNGMWFPPRQISLLEVADEPDVLEIHPPFSPPPPYIGYLETSWARRTCSTPPPYCSMDKRRSPTMVANIVEEDLPVSPPAYQPPRPESEIDMARQYVNFMRAARLPNSNIGQFSMEWPNPPPPIPAIRPVPLLTQLSSSAIPISVSNNPDNPEGLSVVPIVPQPLSSSALVPAARPDNLQFNWTGDSYRGVQLPAEPPAEQHAALPDIWLGGGVRDGAELSSGDDYDDYEIMSDYEVLYD